MDEELEQSSSKVNVDSFFQSLQPVNETAQAALAQAEVSFSLAQQNNQLIQAIQSSLLEVRTGVNEITNYIIIQQKQKTKQLDKLADDIVAKEDKQQKGGKSRTDKLKDTPPFDFGKKKTDITNLVKSLGDVASQALSGANSQIGSLAALGLVGAGSKLFEKKKNKKNYNLGGEVSGSGDSDTVPAMLTPGEFVISKDAVNQVGVDTLKNINAAAGSTSEPSLLGSIGTDKEGNLKTFTKIGDKTESELTSADGSFTMRNVTDMSGGGLDETTTTSYNKTFTEEDGTVTTLEEEQIMRERISSIGVPDLIEHKDQLLGEIHKLKGFENVTIDQVINSATGIPKDKLLDILLKSDAQKATSEKEDKAREEDLKARGIKPGQGFSISANDEIGKLLAGTMGYRMGQINPDTLVTSTTTFKDKTKTTSKTGVEPKSDSFLGDLSASINASVKGYNEGGLVEAVSKPQVKSNDLTPPDDDMEVQILPPISQVVGDSGDENKSASIPFTPSSIDAEPVGETASSVTFIDVISNTYLSLA